MKGSRRFSGAERARHHWIERIVKQFITLAIINPILNHECNANLPVL